jgi:hypothetical protein
MRMPIVTMYLVMRERRSSSGDRGMLVTDWGACLMVCP